jgi:YD repeat-containing protein
MNIKFLVLIIFLGVLSKSNAQMLDNSKGETFSDRPFFNTQFIKQNKIKKIKGYYSTKTDRGAITPNDDIYVYLFNLKGELIKEYKTHNLDTTVTLYAYDESGNLTSIRRSDNYGFHSYKYTYNDSNRIISKSYLRDVNKANNKIDFELERSYQISTETNNKENTPIGLKKFFYNSQGLLYKTEFFYRDADGYLLKQESSLKTGSGRAKTTYSYGDFGLMSEKATETFLGSKTTAKIKFEYDENQNVLAQHYYRNSKYITEYQIIYNQKTMLLKAILTRDVGTDFITIIKLTDYEFYGNNKPVNDTTIIERRK